MQRELLLSLLIEAVLVTASILFLAGPRTFVPLQSARGKSIATTAGIFILCATFCWSVVFGCILALHQATLRI